MTSSAQVSPANPQVSQDDGDTTTTNGGSGPKSDDSWAYYDQSGLCWKTRQGSLASDSGESLTTWPRAGMASHGACYPPADSERHTHAKGCSSLPTPAAFQAGWRHISIVDRNGGFPTSAQERWYQGNTGRMVQKGVWQVAAWILGLKWSDAPPLNPFFTEWLMGFPEGWTENER